MDFLGYPQHWKTVQIDETDNEIIVKAESLDTPTCCPRCNGPASALRPHGSKLRKLKDPPVRGKPVTVLMKVRRYWCDECNKTSLQPVYGVAPGGNVTNRLANLVASEAMREQLHNVARRTRLSTRTVRDILQSYGAQLEKTQVPRMPRVLGIDGVYINKVERFIMTDLEKRLVVNLLPTATDEGLTELLPTLSNLKNVEIVVIDMCHRFRRLIQKLIPSAVIVIDRYHVQQYANKAVDAVRKAVRVQLKSMCHRKLLRRRWKSLTTQERRELATWFRRYPELRDAYYMKEKFGDIWHSSCSATARARFEEWLKVLITCCKLVRDCYAKMARMIRRWRTYIFNYFDYRFTNAFTERSNRRIKQMMREGNGYKFETVRIRLIFGQADFIAIGETLRSQHDTHPQKSKRRSRRVKRKSTHTSGAKCKCPAPGLTQMSLFPKDDFES
jgi:transposase